MNTSFRTKRLIVRLYQRGYIDIVAWFIFLLLTIGFTISYFWYHFDYSGTQQGYGSLESFITQRRQSSWTQAMFVVLKDALVYTIWMMMPVYFNLFWLKPKILDRVGWNKMQKYTTYVFCAIVIAFSAAAVASFILPASISRMKIDLPINALTIFGVMLISTGMVFSRDMSGLAKRYRRLQQKKKAAISHELETQLQSDLSVYTNHIKVGKKSHFKIIPFEEILYFQGDGNEPIIVTSSGRHFGTSNLSDYEGFLPKSRFLRVHRSYILSKEKVLGRRGNEFLIKDDENNLIKIPIGKTYLDMVDKDDYLGFR